jgi:hypothetical protein
MPDIAGMLRSMKKTAPAATRKADGEAAEFRKSPAAFRKAEAKEAAAYRKARESRPRRTIAHG